MNAKAWLYSILAAFIGGGASSAVVMYIDPAKFNFTTGLGNLGVVFFVAGLFKVLAFLATSPLPQTILSTTVTQTESVKKIPGGATTTVATTKTETVEKPPEPAPPVPVAPA